MHGFRVIFHFVVDKSFSLIQIKLIHYVNIWCIWFVKLKNQFYY